MIRRTNFSLFQDWLFLLRRELGMCPHLCVKLLTTYLLSTAKMQYLPVYVLKYKDSETSKTYDCRPNKGTSKRLELQVICRSRTVY